MWKTGSRAQKRTGPTDVVLALCSLCNARWGGEGDWEPAGYMPRAMKACSSILSGGEGQSDSPRTEGVETGLPEDKRCGQGPAIVIAAGWTPGARGRSHGGTARPQSIVKTSAAPAPVGKAQLAQMRAWPWFLPQPKSHSPARLGAVLRCHLQLP